jgi:hypothetical protein
MFYDQSIYEYQSAAAAKTVLFKDNIKEIKGPLADSISVRGSRAILQ